MVYVFAKVSKLNKYIGRKLTADQIKSALLDLGMDIKGDDGSSDPELKIEITAEKTDWVSTPGIARAIKYYLGFSTQIPKYTISNSNNKIIVEKSVSKVRPRIAAAVIRGMNIDEETLNEIIDLQEKIHDSFGRKRKKAAIGIYPLDKITFPLAYKGESPSKIRFTPLDGIAVVSSSQILTEHEKGREFGNLISGFSEYPILVDANNKILSMPPIINSEEAGRVISGTKDVFIECTGHNQTYLDTILKVLVTTLLEFGGRAESVKVEYWDGEKYELNLDNYPDEIKIDYVNKLIGLKITEKEITSLLNKAMYGVKGIKNGAVQIEIPVFRNDVWHDADIADDIARAYGYNNIIPKYPQIASTSTQLDFSLFRERISQTMVSLGFIELYTYMLTSTETQFDKMSIDSSSQPHVKLIDSADMGTNMVRTLILPENLLSLNINRKNKYPQKVFENGFTINVADYSEPTNEAHLCVSIADGKSNYTKIKAVIDTLMAQNNIQFELKKSQHKFLISGRQAEILVNGSVIGFIGEIHPQVLDNFGLLVPVSSLEINLNKLWNIKNK
jgi:phenylalanyl-tRNA synthetase beta chain